MPEYWFSLISYFPVLIQKNMGQREPGSGIFCAVSYVSTTQNFIHNNFKLNVPYLEQTCLGKAPREMPRNLQIFTAKTLLI